MEQIRLTHENLSAEHICCAISNNNDPQVASKKAWLADRISEGLVFLKSKQRGKCFIEYIPAEYAWVPVSAPGYLHINCFWVSGSLKGHGYANELLDACIRDGIAAGKHGITVISSPKKKPFLSDPDYLKHRGFLLADQADPFFDLLYLPLDKHPILPQFCDQVKNPRIADETGFVLYYSAGCPYTAKYVPLIAATAQEAGIRISCIKIDSCAAAQAAPTVWTNYTLFYNGKFVTNEILSEKKFRSIAERLQANS